jgi:hypothetical protein
MARTEAGRAAGIAYGADPDTRLVDEHEAAARLGLTVATFRRWRWARKGVPWIKVGVIGPHRVVRVEC